MTSFLPVSVRRFVGLRVNGPKPGFKRPTKARTGLVTLDGGVSLTTLDRLSVGQGVLITAPLWRQHHKTFAGAEQAVRALSCGKFSVRRAYARGGRPDMLVLRLA